MVLITTKKKKAPIIIVFLFARATFRLDMLSPSFSVCSARNTRPYMEDRFVVNTSMHLVDYKHSDWQGANGLFLVCDGHAGSACAEFMANGFVLLLPRISSGTIAIEVAVESTLERLTMEWKETNPTDFSGCTFVALLINYKSAHAVSINIGDSRLMQFDAKGVTVWSTTQHDLENPEERAEIERRVLSSTRKQCLVQPDGHGHLRIGGLNMARALGDRAPYIDGCISSKPDIVSLVLSHVDETTFVLASDGLWDESAVQVGAYIRQQGSAQDIVRDVTLLAHPRASDNLAVMMIQFRPQHQRRPFETPSGLLQKNALQLARDGDDDQRRQDAAFLLSLSEHTALEHQSRLYKEQQRNLVKTPSPSHKKRRNTNSTNNGASRARTSKSSKSRESNNAPSAATRQLLHNKSNANSRSRSKSKSSIAAAAKKKEKEKEEEEADTEEEDDDDEEEIEALKIANNHARTMRAASHSTKTKNKSRKSIAWQNEKTNKSLSDVRVFDYDEGVGLPTPASRSKTKRVFQGMPPASSHHTYN